MLSKSYFQSDQIINDAQLAIVGSVAGEELSSILSKLDLEINQPVRLSAKDDFKLYISANTVILADGSARTTSPIDSVSQSTDDITIDFQTGVVSPALSVTNVGSTFSLPAYNTGLYCRMALTLTSSNTIDVAFSEAASSYATLTDAGVVLASLSGTPIGWIDLVSTGTGFKSASSAGVSATSIIQSAVSGKPSIFKLGSGAGGGGGGAVVKIEPPPAPDDGFNAVIWDDLGVNKTAADSKVRPTETNAKWLAAKKIYQASCDKLKTITSSTTAYTLSSAPSYTVVAGDIIYSGGEFRRILTVTSQTVGVLDAAFTTAKVAAACMVSQAVWTYDLVNYGSSTELNRLRDFFPSSLVESLSFIYTDSNVTNDIIPDFNTEAKMVVSASNFGLTSAVDAIPSCDTFAPIYARVTTTTQLPVYNLLSPTDRKRLFLVFFPNPNGASVTTTANLISYQVSLYPVTTIPLSGGNLNSAYGTTNNTGTNFNCSVAQTNFVYTGNIANTSNQLTTLSNVTGIIVGMTIFGTGIPAGTTVLSVSGTTVTMSANAIVLTTVYEQREIGFTVDYSSFNMVPNAYYTYREFNDDEGDDVYYHVVPTYQTYPVVVNVVGTNLQLQVTFIGFTTITLDWTFIPQVNFGQPDSDIEVLVEGQIIPRYYVGVVGDYWKEVGTSNNKVQLWADLSLYGYTVHVRRRQGVLDSSSQNNLRILTIENTLLPLKSDSSYVSSQLALKADLVYVRSKAEKSTLANHITRYWTTTASPSGTQAWEALCWSPELGLFVALARIGTSSEPIAEYRTQLMTSPDGVTWIARSCPHASWSAICWSPELSLFVAVGNNSTNTAAIYGYHPMTSPDGVTWTLRTQPDVGINPSLKAVCWSPELSLFVALGSNSAGFFFTSPDGVTWTARSCPAASWLAICWSPELSLFVAVSNGSAMTSPDGVSWIARSCPAASWQDMCWSPELRLFVAVRVIVSLSGIDAIMTSPDGVTWTLRSVPTSVFAGQIFGNLTGVCWSPELGLFVAVGSRSVGNVLTSGLVLTSPDGITWKVKKIADNTAFKRVSWSPDLSLFAAVSGSAFISGNPTIPTTVVSQ